METETRSFELFDEEEPDRILRGRIESPLGAEERDAPLPAVIVVHGFKGFMDWGFFPELSRRIARHDMVAISFNMSGSGIGEDLESFTDEAAFEHNTPTRELEDLDAVRGFLGSGALPWVDASRLGIFGHSLGGGIALLHAAEHGDLRALVTWSAISRIDRHGAEMLDAWRRDGFLPIPNTRTGQTHRLGLGWLEDIEARREELDIVAACRRLRTSALLVQGTDDESVAPAEAETLLAAIPSGVARFLAVAGAGHTFGATHPLEAVPDALGSALDATIRHLDEHLR